ncbi:MAG: hypothetical protein AAGJ55_01005 [Cyanobacteria bacterium J06555_12]
MQGLLFLRWMSARRMKARWIGIGAALVSCAILTEPASAQRIRDIPEKAAQIYELVPDLPGSGEDERWLQRVLLYHVRTKGRLTDSRFDWRLTFADFLEANEPIFADQYPPGSTELNPLNGDREHFQAMTRQDRNEFLAAILEVYGNNSVTNSLELANQGGQTESTSVTVEE